MIQFERKTLDNGLRVIVHEDPSTPMVAVNVVYDVGSRDEDENQTGFAHLFEHLMFGGSEHIPDFDIPVQTAGGENNAFTNSDVTNFYTVLPAANVETALWLESDRMGKLAFSEKTLATQKKVVIEEFKETCLNEPYGDMWHHIADLAYTHHGYRWPTIGLTPDHIEKATLQDVKDFFHKHYAPINAVLIIAGNIKSDVAFTLAEKWFLDIPSGIKYTRDLTLDDPHIGKKYRSVQSNVPARALLLGFPMVSRTHPDYYCYDILSDILGNGRSSRFYERLHREQQLFNQIDAYISGTNDPGLLVIEGRPTNNTSWEEANDAIWKELTQLQEQKISDRELQKIKNKIECSLEYAEVNILHKAMSLAFFELMGNADFINEEGEKYQNVTADDLCRIANTVFDKNNYLELRYIPKHAEK